MTVSRPLLLAVAVLAAALPTAGAAQADPPWSAPAPGPGFSNGPGAVTARGHVAALVASDRNQPPGTASQLLRLDPATGHALSSAGVDVADARIAASAQDAIAVAGSSIGPSGTVDDASRVRAGTVPAAGGAPALRTLSGTQGQSVSGLAGDARGDVALVTRGGRSRFVYLRSKGSSTFSRVLTLTVSSTARDATVALSPDGQLLVVWEDQHELFARHRGTSGRWGAVHRLGPGVQSNLQAAIDPGGRELVAWKSQRVSEGEASDPAVVSFITAAPGHGFGTRRTIETAGVTGAGHFVSAPGVRLEVTGRDTALLTWTGFDGTSFVVRAAPVSQGHVGARQQLSTAGVDAVLGDLAVAPGGPALVLWRLNVRGADPVTGQQPLLYGSVRAAGAPTFGTPESIGGPDVPVFTPPTALVSPATGGAIALFSGLTPNQVLTAARATSTP
jgi:hypothetical protein